MTAATEPKCAFCDRNGLLLMPVRYAVAPLDPAKVPWQTLMDQYTLHVKALLKPDIAARVLAMLSTQAATDQERKTRLATEMTHWGKGSEAQQAAAVQAYGSAVATTQQTRAHAQQVVKDAGTKLLPDSVAMVLVQITAPLATLLREFNDNAGEKALIRWMAIVGVTLRTPVGVIEVNGTAQQTIKFLARTFVDNLAQAGVQSGKPLSAQQIKQLTTYTERQVAGSFASGDIGAFETRGGTRTTSKMAVFITPEMAEELKSISDPTRKIEWLVAHVKTPQTLHEYGVLKIASRLDLYSSVSEGALTAIDALFKYVGWQHGLKEEANALSFQKTWSMDVRNTLGGALYAGALATGAGTVVKTYGAWRNLRAAGMAEQLAGEQLVKRATIALRVLGVVTAAVSGVVAVMDLVDSVESNRDGKQQLRWLQIVSGSVGIAAAAIGIWAAFAINGGATMLTVGIGGITLGFSLTLIGVVLAVVMAALALVIRHIKGNDFAQWLERCYWGTLPEDRRYDSATQEQTDFQKAMGGA